MTDSGENNIRRVSVQRALRVWREERAAVDIDAPQGDIHISAEQFAALAAEGGLADASPELVEHLSLCPACITHWADAVRSAEQVIEEPLPENVVPLFDYGLRKAAATMEAVTARVQESESGLYTLELAPDLGDPDKGLVTLEVKASVSSCMEGCGVTVRDLSGRVVVKGTVRGGYLSGRLNNLTELDLDGGWTVIVDG